MAKARGFTARVDKGLLSHAKEKGVAPVDLSLEEKMRFVTELSPGEITKLNKMLSGGFTGQPVLSAK